LKSVQEQAEQLVHQLNEQYNIPREKVRSFLDSFPIHQMEQNSPVISLLACVPQTLCYYHVLDYAGACGNCRVVRLHLDFLTTGNEPMKRRFSYTFVTVLWLLIMASASPNISNVPNATRTIWGVILI